MKGELRTNILGGRKEKDERRNEENKVRSETQSERGRKEEKYREEGQRVEERGSERDW